MPLCSKAYSKGTSGWLAVICSKSALHLQSCETVLNQLRKGLASFEHALGERPKVYGRRRYGLSVLHPQLLGRLGYVGVLHAALGEGQYPEGSQLKIRWEGPDHRAIDTIGAYAARRDPLGHVPVAGQQIGRDHGYGSCRDHLSCPLARSRLSLVRRPAPGGSVRRDVGQVRDGRRVFSRYGLSRSDRTVQVRPISLTLLGTGRQTGNCRSDLHIHPILATSQPDLRGRSTARCWGQRWKIEPTTRHPS